MKLTDAFGRPFPIMHVLLNVGPGWRDIVLNLIDDLEKLGWNGGIHQIKEKFGGLRFYTGGSEAIFNRIDEAESESLKTCDVCGGDGTIVGEGWWVCRCPKHAKEV